MAIATSIFSVPGGLAPNTGVAEPGMVYDSTAQQIKLFDGTNNIAADTYTGTLKRVIVNPTAKTIVDGSATSLFSVAVPALSGIGGMFVFLVRASDGTEFQADAGIVTYSAETKATVVVGTITYVAANEAKAVSSGTITLSFTADVSVANVVTYKVQPTGSLTETTPYTIEYTVFPIRGVVTIL